MATIAINNIVRSVRPGAVFESAKSVITTAVSYNQGDLICFDDTNNRLKAVALTADAATILGVAIQTIVSGKVVGPYSGTAVDASVALSDLKGPVYGVVASLKLKVGDSFAPGDKVYVTVTDAQTVTVTDPGDANHIGIYQGAAVTAAAGSKGDIMVGNRFGGTGLQF
jgi:hypothetical protein